MNTWTRLEDGTWGVALPNFYPSNADGPGPDVNSGLPVTVKTKSGEKKTVVIGDFVKKYRIKGGIIVKVYRVQP